MVACGQLQSVWNRIWTTFPLKYFPPLSDPVTFLIIGLQSVWTWLVVTQLVEEGDELPFDVSSVFNILTATLGFILPLQLNTALTKNHSCLDNYNALCGDVLAFAWECVSLTKGNKVLESKSAELKKIFHILVALPAMVKHHFRGTMDMTRVKTLEDAALINGNGATSQQELQALYQTIIVNGEKEGMGEVEVCFMKLLDYIKDYAGDDPVDPVRRSLLFTWNRVYGSWGNMSNISGYTPPSIFTYVLDVALLLYSAMIPLTLYQEGLHAIWMVAIISYFFLGLNIAGKKVGNAFVATEDATGFQNVTPSQKTATKAIGQVWSVRDGIASNFTKREINYF